MSSGARSLRTLSTALLWLGLTHAGCGDSDAIVTTEADGSSTSAPASTTAATTGAATTGASTPGDPTTGAPDTTGELVTTGADAPDTTDGSTSDASTSDDAVGTSSETTGAPDEGTTGVATTIPGPKIKVMTFNIRVGTAADGDNAWDKRKGLVYQVLKDQDADFVGMQEDLNFQLNAIDDAVDGYKRIGIGTVDGMAKGPHNSIYYRKSRFMLTEHDTFWLSDTPGQAGSTTWGNDHPRAVTWGHFIEKDTGYSFYVYNTHFDHISQNSRENSAVLLAKRISNRGAPEDPFVVTGDFNAGESNVVIRFLKGNAQIDGKDALATMRDSFRVFKPDADKVGTAHGFNGGTGGNKIDYVWISPKQEVTNAFINHFNVDGRYPSDHFPVIGVVRFLDKN